LRGCGCVGTSNILWPFFQEVEEHPALCTGELYVYSTCTQVFMLFNFSAAPGWMLGRCVVVAVGIAFAWFCLVLPGEQVSQCIQGQSRTSATHKSPSKHSVGRDIRNPVGGGVLLIWPIRAPTLHTNCKEGPTNPWPNGNVFAFYKIQSKYWFSSKFLPIVLQKTPNFHLNRKNYRAFPLRQFCISIHFVLCPLRFMIIYFEIRFTIPTNSIQWFIIIIIVMFIHKLHWMKSGKCSR